MLLILKAFAAGSSALTGAEAIAKGYRPSGSPVRFHIRPRPGQTVLSQIMRAAVGRGVTCYVVSLTVTGLPAGDNFAPHVFGLRADRPVYRYRGW